jgi:phage-related protein
MKKNARFLGDSLKIIRGFPNDARRQAGFQIDRVQAGLEPNDWKPIPEIGAGVREIRIREQSGAFRMIYQATVADEVLVIHAFQKKTQKAPRHEIETACERLKEFLRGLK